jgi:anti-sigma regulatory factor (Ser/Thr protein kinase)
VRELSHHITDLIENAVRAGARNVEVVVEENLEADEVRVCVRDDGCGMTPEMAVAAFDPFHTTRTCRKVGLGLPLARATAERCDGCLEIESVPGSGTQVTMRVKGSHIDRPPLGNIRATVMTALVGHPEVDLRYTHQVGCRSFELDGAAVKRELDGVPLSHPLVLGWLREFLSQGLVELGVEDAPVKEGDNVETEQS